MSLPPEALAELKRIRLRQRAREAAANALMAATLYQLLYPPAPGERQEEIELAAFLAGR